MKKRNKKFNNKKSQNSLNKLSLFQKNDVRFFKEMSFFSQEFSDHRL